jgi:3-deoxy-7-phosphoheptulonate synthase
MHGNTETTASGLKTRRFERILQELETTCEILYQAGLPLAGVHFELSGEDVTECLGGACGLTEADLTRAYRSPVDPRLNYEQSLEMALHLARLLQRRPGARGTRVFVGTNPATQPPSVTDQPLVRT